MDEKGLVAVFNILFTIPGNFSAFASKTVVSRERIVFAKMFELEICIDIEHMEI